MKDYKERYAIIHFKSTQQKLNFAMSKAILKRYSLECFYKCSSTFSCSYAQKRSLVFNRNYFHVKLKTFCLAKAFEN